MGGEWTSVQELRDEEATVVCKQLGFPNSFHSLTTSDSSLSSYVKFFRLIFKFSISILFKHICRATQFCKHSVELRNAICSLHILFN